MKNGFYQHVDRHWNLDPSPDSCKPIFLIASVWRTGSTLTQRLIVSSNELIMWGEPFASCAVIQNLYNTTRSFIEPYSRLAWPQFTLSRMKEEERDTLINSMGRQWIANLYPDIRDLKESYRLMLDRIFYQSAQKEGFERFGIKFVRLTVEHVQFLQWIYPDARIVFLTRNPYDSWNSYNGCNWNYRYPDLNISKLGQFIKIWEKNTNEFSQFTGQNIKMFRYEDVINSSDVRRELKEHCHLEAMDETILAVREKGIPNTDNLKGISSKDIQQIDRMVGKTAKKFGYISYKNTI